MPTGQARNALADRASAEARVSRPGGADASGAPAPAPEPQRQLLPLAALGTVYVVWGSTYLGIRVAVETIPPMLMAGLRFCVAGAILYFLSVRRGDRVGDRPRRFHWRSAAIIGGLLLVGGNAMVGEAERTLPSGIAALLVATIPAWFVGLDRLLNGVPIRRGAAAGICVALVGAVLLVRPTPSQHVDLLGTLLLIVATACWALGSLYSRDARLPRRPLVGSGMEMLAGGGIALVVSLLLGEWHGLHVSSISTRSWIALVYLVVAGSLLAYSAYQYALHSLPTTTVSTYAYVNPIIAVVLGALLLGEHVGLTTVVAAIVMIAGVALVIRNPSRPRSPA